MKKLSSFRTEGEKLKTGFSTWAIWVFLSAVFSIFHSYFFWGDQNSNWENNFIAYAKLVLDGRRLSPKGTFFFFTVWKKSRRKKLSLKWSVRHHTPVESMNTFLWYFRDFLSKMGCDSTFNSRREKEKERREKVLNSASARIKVNLLSYHQPAAAAIIPGTPSGETERGKKVRLIWWRNA